MSAARVEAKMAEWLKKLLTLLEEGYEIEFSESGGDTRDLFFVIRTRKLREAEAVDG